MGFLRNRLKIKNDTAFTLNDPNVSDFFRNMGLDVTDMSGSSELSEVVYFTCLKHLSETVSKMPWVKRTYSEKTGKEKINDSELDILLNLRPNPLYTASIFWGSVELNKLHYGNAYAYVETRNGKPSALWLLPSNEVQIWRDDGGIFGEKNAIWFVWLDSLTGKTYKFMQDEILHFKTSMTFNGIVGMPVKDILRTQIQTNMYAEGFLKKLYENNMFGGKVILNYTGDLNSTAERSLASKIESYSATQGSGKFIPLPLGITATLLDMKLSDAQFFENNKLNALQIAAAFGIKPNVINNYEKSSYSNSETQQLDFYVNTLQPSFKAYSQEVSYKLLPNFELKKGYRLEINEKILFKMDSKTQAEVYAKYLNNFVMTPNEVREELDLPFHDGASELIGNGNYIKIGQIGDQWKTGGEE